MCSINIFYIILIKFVAKCIVFRNIYRMNQKEFTTYVTSDKEKMITLARKMGSTPEEAKDIVQDALLKLWVIREQVDKERIQAFAMTITKNLVIDVKRKQSRYSAGVILEKVETIDASNPHSLLEEAENKQRFRLAAELLPDSCRAVLIMKQQESMEIKDIARVLDTTESSVRGLLCRARKLMLENLKQKKQ